MTFDRIARWADDLTFDFAPGEILRHCQRVNVSVALRD